MASLCPDTLLEAIDGPVAVGSLEGKSMPILTRFPDGRIGFRIMGKFVKSPEPKPLVRVVFETGLSVRLGADQVLIGPGGSPIRAGELKPGDRIVWAWDYRPGYRPPDLPQARPSDGTLQVKEVAPEGEGEVYSAPIRETGVFFLHCGALLQA
jgi:hypothetical protein